MKNHLLGVAAALFLISCNAGSGKDSTPSSTVKPTDSSSSSKPQTGATPVATGSKADAATIMGRKQVPILCYHHIRPIQMASRANKGYEVTVQQFKDQMKVLADSGYHSITPDEYYNYLVYGASLPEKPVMITFDDTSEEHFTIAKPEMEKYGFKGVYFIMTISINRPRYMTTEQIKELSDAGHIIASHTWDHHRVDKYIVGDRTIQDGKKQKTFNDWDVQLAGSKKKLEEITGKPVEYFAYPFGIWSKPGIPEIEKRGYKMAYQLSTVRDSLQPLFTARRMIVSPEWSAPGMVKVMKSTFK